jgi:hypothetical protein
LFKPFFHKVGMVGRPIDFAYLDANVNLDWLFFFKRWNWKPSKEASIAHRCEYWTGKDQYVVEWGRNRQKRAFLYPGTSEGSFPIEQHPGSDLTVYAQGWNGLFCSDGGWLAAAKAINAIGQFLKDQGVNFGFGGYVIR